MDLENGGNLSSEVKVENQKTTAEPNYAKYEGYGSKIGPKSIKASIIASKEQKGSSKGFGCIILLVALVVILAIGVPILVSKGGKSSPGDKGTYAF